MDDRDLRLRLDVDVRGTDEVGLGAMRAGPAGPPLRDGEAAVVLATELARVALATIPLDSTTRHNAEPASQLPLGARVSL